MASTLSTDCTKISNDWCFTYCVEFIFDKLSFTIKMQTQIEINYVDEPKSHSIINSFKRTYTKNRRLFKSILKSNTHDPFEQLSTLQSKRFIISKLLNEHLYFHEQTLHHQRQHITRLRCQLYIQLITSKLLANFTTNLWRTQSTEKASSTDKWQMVHSNLFVRNKIVISIWNLQTWNCQFPIRC